MILKMLKFTLLCLTVTVVIQTALCYSTYNSISTPNGGAYSSASSSGSGSGFSGGYSGSNGINSRAGGGGGPFPAPFGPFPSFDRFVNPGEFNKVLGSYFEDLQKNYAKLYQQQLSNQADIFNNIRHQVQSAQSGSNGYAPNYASASAAYGPGGIHQTASIYPENPASPNVNTRFGIDQDIGNGGRPGYYGVSTSSFAESSNVNGVEKNRKGAVTTVNDNGKITSYKTGS